MNIRTFARYWHTLSHLRPQQIGGQLWMRLGTGIRRKQHETSAHPEAYSGAHVSEQSWLPTPAHHAQDNPSDLLLQGHFRFINETKQLHWPPDWFAEKSGKLWQYNLHYFEWLWQLSTKDAMAAVLDWIQFSQKYPYHVGWEPYPTSLRLMNWCGLFFHRKNESFEQLPPSFQKLLWESICTQGDWLTRHLEHHLMGNHLFENAVTLTLLGSRFKGSHAERWLNIGLPLLEREVKEQLPQDGLHFERSPMYHLRFVYLMLLLLQQGEPRSSAIAKRHLPRMLRAMSLMCHPDEQIALFNDSAFGIYHLPSQLLAWAKESNVIEDDFLIDHSGPWVLSDAGYYGAQTPTGDAIICDAGWIGPDYIPGHAHADIFSFELSLQGHRVLVDSGVCDYLNSEMRRFCRSTQGHNTVEIDGRDQCQLWGAFRVAKRGYPTDIEWQSSGGQFKLSGWHDGYTKTTKKNARHRRIFEWDGTKSQILKVQDRVQADQSVRVVSRLHLHPSCSILQKAENSVTIAYPGGSFRIGFTGSGELQTEEQSWYCPAFGKAEANRVLTFTATGSSVHFGFQIER